MGTKLCYNCFQEIDEHVRFCTNCGHSTLDERDKYPHALPWGTILAGRYIIGRVLGQGGFGITYVAQDHKTRQLVAIKEFFPDTMATRGASNSAVPYTGQRGDDFNYGKAAFLEEARTLAQFHDSPGVVQIHSYFEENGTAYFAMEYVDGQSLQSYIAEKGGRLTWPEARRILLPVAEALAAVHAKGIIHRDIKPDNIYINSEGQIKILDFGSARYSMGEKSRSLDVVLTHGFAPREQYSRHGRQGPYTDVYALAATFYYAITGRKPPDSIDRLDDDSLALPSSLGAQLPQIQEDVLMKALSIEPQDRYATMDAFRDALLGIPAQASPAPVPAAAAVSGTPGMGYAPAPAQGRSSASIPPDSGQRASDNISPPSRQHSGVRQGHSAIQTPPGSATPNSVSQAGQRTPPAPAKKSGIPKWLFPLWAGILVVAVIAGIVIWRGTRTKAPEDPAPEASVTLESESAPPSQATEPSPSETVQPENSPNQLGGTLGPSSGAVTGYYPVSSMAVNDSSLGASALAGEDITGENTYVVLETETSGVISLFDGEEMEFTLRNGNMWVDQEEIPYTLEDGKLTITVDDGEDIVVLVFTRSSDSRPAVSTPAADTSGTCGDSAYWDFADSTLTISGTGKMYDYEYEDDIPWFALNEQIDFVVIEDGITRIGEGAFFQCEMVDVEIPDTVEAIGAYAFMQCPYLFDITIPASVKGLGTAALSGCPRLEWVKILSPSISIYKEAFIWCDVLESVTFEGSIEQIGTDAFRGDTTTVYYPGGDPTWSSLIGQDFGGTLTWEPLAEDGIAERIFTDKYSIGIPDAWSSSYSYTITGDQLNFFHKASADSGYGGFLFAINLYITPDDYAYFPSYQVLGTLSGDHVTYDVVALFPTDVQFTPNTQSQYQMMSNNLNAAFDHLQGANGYQFSFG